MDFDKIEKVIAIMEEHSLTEFTFEEGGEYKLSLKKGNDTPLIMPSMASAAPAAPAAAAPAAASDAGLEIIESPLVGVFYSAASPESDVFVSKGSSVTDDSIVCIIEAMKVMNEIKAEITGEIVEILVENGSPVEYGQPLFKVKKA